MLKGPYEILYIYELEGILEEIPQSWRRAGFLGHWIESGYSFAFFATPAREMIERDLVELSGITLRSETVLPYEEWEAGVPLRPFKVGNLTVAPPWAVHAQEAPDTRLLIDPGVTFGSGLHPSTRVSLELMVELFENLRPETVLDLGTGSGILALASLRLGALKALAVDNQPVSVERALYNAKLNKLEDSVRVELGDALVWVTHPAELLLANLDLNLLKTLVTHRGIREKRWVILSGVLETQWKELVRFIEPGIWELIQRVSSQGWTGALFRNARL